LPTHAQGVDIAGIWQVSGFTKSYGNLDFLVKIKRFGANGWNAVKLSSSNYVPSGRQHFQGRITGTTMQASVQVAFPGFGEPEWETHQFRLDLDNQGKVTGIVLTSGEQHFLDDTGERSITDNWTYTPWPEDRLLLSAPLITHNGYASETSLARGQIQSAERDIERWKPSLSENTTRLSNARRNEAKILGDIARLQILYETANTAVSAAKSGEADAMPDRTNLPSRLRVLYGNRTRAEASIKRNEAIILAHTSGTAVQPNATITQLFKNIDNSRAFIQRLDLTIARVREELGIAPEEDPATGRDERIRMAEAAAKTAGDAYYGARRILARAKTEAVLAEGQVKLAQEQIVEAKTRVQTARDRLKFINLPITFNKVEGYTLGGSSPRLVFEAIPSGLDGELRALKKVLNEVDVLLEKSQVTSNGLKAEFQNAFDRGTVSRDQMADLIYANAAEMAATTALAKTGEFALAFGTGGPVGLAIEMVTTPALQFALYDDGVVFENYDQRALGNQYRAALASATHDQPDPQDACRGLNIQISNSIKGRLLTQTSSQMQSYLEAINQGGSGASADIPNSTPLGNSSQRIQPNLLNYFAIGGAGTVSELTANAGDRVLVRGIANATQEFEQRVSQRMGQSILREIARFDAQILNSSATAASRASATAARTAALERFASQNPGLAAEITQNIQQHARNMGRYEKILRLATNNSSSGETAAANQAAHNAIDRIREQQNTLRRTLSSSVPEINIEQALRTQKSLWLRLGAELEKLDRFKSSFAKVGLRGASRASKIKAGAVNIAFSITMAVLLDQNMNRLQRQEMNLWKKIFQAEIEQSMMFRAWQRSRCIDWALLDQRDFLKRNYTRLYNTYDPDAQMQVLRSEPIQNHEGLRLRLILDPPQAITLRARVSGLSCPRSTQSGCQISAGELVNVAGPYLSSTIDIGPP